MITKQQTASDITAWFTGRLPNEWAKETPEITIDDEEIVIKVRIDTPQLEEGVDESAVAAAAAGRASGWREETRAARIAIAKEAQHLFDRRVSWGVNIGDHSEMFTHIGVPVMTRLRQPERQVLDTLVEAGVAKSRSDALRWSVKLVGKHSEEWLGELRSAMDQVRTVRDQGPDA